MKQIYNLLITGLFGVAAHAQCTTPTLSNVTGPTEPICSGSTATLTATTDGQSISWFTAATGGTQAGTGTTFVTPPLSGTTSYWAEARNNGGTGTPTSGGGKLAPGGTDGTTVNTASDPWGLAFTATSDFVLNSVDVFLTSGSAGNVLLYLKDAGYNTLQTLTIPVPAGGTNNNPVQYTMPLNLTITAGNSYKLVIESGPAMIRDLGSNNFPYAIGTVGTITGGTINNSTANSGVYYFMYNWNFTPGSAPCLSARQQVTVTVNPAPTAPTASAQTFCGSGTVADLTATGSSLKWYSASTGGTELATDTALATGNYYVSQSNASCESTRTTVAVTLNPIPDAPVAVAQSFCGTGTVSGLQANGTGLKWYTDATGGTALAGTVALDNGTYYVSQTAATCESARTPVTITINAIPDAPEAEAQSYCGTATVAELEANGSTLKWYSNATGGAALTATTAVNSGTYYVSQTVGTCESDRTAVAVTINTVPDAPEASAQSFCGDANVGDLLPNGGPLQWYASETGTPLTSFTALATGTYYVRTTSNNCQSEFTSVAVTVNAIPDAPDGLDQQTVNEGDTIADLIVDGENLTWYGDSFMTVELEETTVLQDNTTYYVMQTVNGCPSPLLGIHVSIALGINEEIMAGLTFYPNPVENSFTITNNQAISTIEVYSLLGQSVMSKNCDSETVSLDLSKLASGTYIVKVKSGSAVKNIRIAKK